MVRQLCFSQFTNSQQSLDCVSSALKWLNSFFRAIVLGLFLNVCIALPYLYGIYRSLEACFTTAVVVSVMWHGTFYRKSILFYLIGMLHSQAAA